MGKTVTSSMTNEDWSLIAESEFIDVVLSALDRDMGFVFKHPEKGLHGFRYLASSATLEPVVFSRLDPNEEEEREKLDESG